MRFFVFLGILVSSFLLAQEAVLVTGGAGYIGSHVCKLLKKNGYLPIVYDNLSQGHKSNVKWGPLEIGDVRDQKRLSEVFIKYKPVAVMHFAGFALVGESMKDPAKYYDNNVGAMISLLKVMLDCQVKYLVFSSSCTTYGIPVTDTIDENHPQNPISPYGSSKLMIERMIKDYDKAYGLKAVALRYFNAAGADLDGEIGEDHEPESHIIPSVIKAALGQDQKVTIFGSDFATLDGTAVRDYIHVNDIAMAHLKALSYLLQKGEKKSLFLNLGSGTGFSVLEIIENVKKYTGKDFPVEFAGRREGDPARLVAHNSAALEQLGIKLEYSDLKTIITSAFKWHQAQMRVVDQNK